jgi:predicted AAA+ superfamily ATPase
MLAARSGQLVAAGSLEPDLQITRPTVARYMRLLEEIFLIKRIPGWSRNLGTRATTTPKLTFVDSGIAARLLSVDSHTLRRPGAPFGPLLEGFVISELARQPTWSTKLADLYHYRDHNKVEGDVVLENRRRHVIGIEVKAASTVRTDDFAGLRQLAQNSAKTSSRVSCYTPARRHCRSARSSGHCLSALSGSSDRRSAGRRAARRFWPPTADRKDRFSSARTVKFCVINT